MLNPDRLSKYGKSVFWKWWPSLWRLLSDAVCVTHLSVPEADYANAFWFSRTGLRDSVFFTGSGLQSALFKTFQRRVFFLMSAWAWGSVTLCLSQVAWHFNVAINSMGDMSLQLLVHSQVTPVPSKRLTCWEKYFHKQSISKSQGHNLFHMQTFPQL